VWWQEGVGEREDDVRIFWCKQRGACEVHLSQVG
jgi:hypothetical protein